MSEPSNKVATPERILDAAERLFLERGFRGASLRALTSAAGVNLAAVGYHFGGKDELLRAVLERQVAPVNAERLRRLDAIEAGWRAGKPRELEPVLEALLEPAFASMLSGAIARDVATLLYSEPHENMPQLVESLFGECSQRFHGAIARVLGLADPNATALRFQMLIGAMIHFLAGRHRLSPAFTGLGEDVEDRTVLAELVAFAAAGLRASAREKSRTRTRAKLPRRRAHAAEETPR